MASHKQNDIDQLIDRSINLFFLLENTNIIIGVGDMVYGSNELDAVVTGLNLRLSMKLMKELPSGYTNGEITVASMDGTNSKGVLVSGYSSTVTIACSGYKNNVSILSTEFTETNAGMVRYVVTDGNPLPFLESTDTKLPEKYLFTEKTDVELQTRLIDVVHPKMTHIIVHQRESQQDISYILRPGHPLEIVMENECMI